jgi:hypothetical protein
MRRDWLNVKSLAWIGSIWHRWRMEKKLDKKQIEREARLREALRTNLRRRKAPGGSVSDSKPSCPKPTD